MKKDSIQDGLFTKARQRVLGLLYCQPDRGFYTNEIIRLTRTGTGAIQRELEKLTAMGLVCMKQVGNQKHYQANKDAAIYAELRSILLKTTGLANVLQQAMESVSSKIRIAFVYGSIAKQEDTLMSDIDLMVIGDDLTYADFFQLLQDVELQLGRKINPTIYSQKNWKQKLKAKNNFITKVVQQPKIFIIGSDDEFEEFR